MIVFTTNSLKLTVTANDKNYIYNNIIHNADDDSILEFGEAVNSLQPYPADKYTKTIEKIITLS